MTKITGAQLANELNPGVREVLEERYGDLLPNMANTVIDMAYGQFYARPGLDLKSRYIATIAALSAMGHQTAPQLRINIEAGLKVGLSEREIAEVIWQMALYGGLPAAINALNTLRTICDERRKS
ncbi:MAG: carboxymuconolactone decarboxylase family protein [Pelagimonas sp.]|uniref:carboxymuconolactone decarboxylase family protein n=1 Tax=Pelagimonas sp. TaxID=2073170 RepID=UPI003D6C3E16